MCTVTVVPVFDRGASPGGRASLCRMVCNRDELRTRAVALPPEIRRFGEQRAILPIDAASGGTWIAASDAGLAFTLLNAYPLPAAELRERCKSESDLLSRGAIIPSLLHLQDLEAVATEVRRLKPDAYPPFRLVVVDRWGAVELRSEGGEVLQPRRWTLGGALMFTSSGLGDRRVEAPRRELFEHMLCSSEGGGAACQDAFHRHRWHERPELSVWMSRAEARTVSRTVIEIGSEVISLAYAAVDADQGVEGESVKLALPITSAPPFAARGIT